MSGKFHRNLRIAEPISGQEVVAMVILKIVGYTIIGFIIAGVICAIAACIRSSQISKELGE